MARIKIKSGEEEAFGKDIFDAWQAAIDADPTNPVIDRTALIAKLKPHLELGDPVTKRQIEIDLVFDTDLNATTRLVWLAIPTPDTDITGLGPDDTWKKFKKKYYDDESDTKKKEKKKGLASGLLFGCGR